jgi:hypothetical protein
LYRSAGRQLCKGGFCPRFEHKGEKTKPPGENPRGFFHIRVFMEYQLIIKIPYEALDDVDAREKAKMIIDSPELQIRKTDTEMKLQRVFQNEPPVGVRLK